eukprot:GHVN01002196.1.p1 GENE.GHVN01002196.1~~GHVN01002196.1.p1  ORF type:complete len:544 (-),score=48.27 GHVN01002196.1:1865-3496(-)
MTEPLPANSPDSAGVDAKPPYVEQSLVTLPKEVQEFLKQLYQKVLLRDVSQIAPLYEKQFNEITDLHYKTARWPSAEAVEDFCQANGVYHQLTMTLYKELYFRHVFANCVSTVMPSDRRLSFENYSPLIDFFRESECCSSKTEPGLKLPDQWLWDILDEYVYQYQETQRWRFKTAIAAGEKPELVKELQEVSLGKEHKEVWATDTIIFNLRALVVKSGIKKVLEKPLPLGEELSFAHSLGYFAMISLLRLHVLLGDYREALSAVSGLDFGGRGFYHRVAACNITLFYNLGFAYMMLRRYHDAIRHFSNVITTINQNRQYIASQSYQKEAMTKSVDKIYQLVTLCNCLSPGGLDDSSAQLIKEKYQEKKDKHQDKFFKIPVEEDDYKDVFLKACPKFVDPSLLDGPLTGVHPEEPQTRQVEAFLRDVRFQRKVSNVGSFTKLYNNIQLQKLGSLMDIKEKNSVEIVRSELLCVKHRGRQMVLATGDDLLGGATVKTLSDVDFYVDNDVVHVKNLKAQQTNVDWFIKQMIKSQELIQELSEPNRK